MTSITIEAEQLSKDLLQRLQDLRTALSADGVNKNDQAAMLINALIEEGIDTGPRRVGALTELGFNQKHAGMMLRTGLKLKPKWPNWGRRKDGTYYLPPRAS
jgi:hypothetical protein